MHSQQLSLSSLILFGFSSFLACKKDKLPEDIGPQYATEFIAVELRGEQSGAMQLAVRACEGLHNRKLGGSVFVYREDQDEGWLWELGLNPKETLTAEDFLAACVTEFPSCVRYSYETQQELLPAIITASSVLEAVPLDENMSITCENPALNAITALADHNTPYLSTKYAFENYASRTTGLAMLNPGYDRHADDLSNPPIIQDMDVDMVDLVFSKELFVTFLVNGCIETDPEYDLLYDIVNAGNWETPIGVYGYNNSWLVGGYLYEAQTRCLESRNMGAIPTETGNLSFFSTRKPAIEEEGVLLQNDLEDTPYDPTKTYVSFVIGDGDNIRFIMSTRNVWLRQRLASCEQSEEACPPLTWSISPHLNSLAPDILEWYYARSHETGNDYFTLPPTGHLYAYPSSLNEQDQDKFVSATEADARLLNLRTVVHWDWVDSWDDAMNTFLPKYAHSGGEIQAVFPVNVPYAIDPFPDWPDDKFYEILSGDGGELVVFKQRQWRGIDDRDEFFLNPQLMAEEIGNYPPGTVMGIYMTSDGGLNLENAFLELVNQLPEHVELVSADTAARLALEAN